MSLCASPDMSAAASAREDALVRTWPLFGLSLITPELVLRPARDEDLPGLAQAVLDGIHDDDFMPFATPWSLANPTELPGNMARFFWEQRAKTEPESWNVPFCVLKAGIPIGVQNLIADDFATVRAVSTGSWLTRREQGKGLGKHMRAAVLMFAFDVLGAQVATTAAFEYNKASRKVSESLGYRANGSDRVATAGTGADPTTGLSYRVECRYTMDREDFARPGWRLQVAGYNDAVAAMLGGQQEAAA